MTHATLDASVHTFTQRCTHLVIGNANNGDGVGICPDIVLMCDKHGGGFFELIANLLGELQMEIGLLICFQVKGVEGVSKLASNEETTSGGEGGIQGMSTYHC
jgi:hypothetical protein